MVDIANIPGLTMRAYDQGESYVNKLFDTQASKQAAQAYAGGDYRGAQQALASRGDLAGVQGIQTQQRTMQRQDAQDARLSRQDASTEAKEKAEFLIQATSMLEQIPTTPEDETQKLTEAYNSIRPALAQIYPPEFIAQLDQAPKTKAGVQQFRAALGAEIEKMQGVNLGGGGYGSFDPRTGNLKVLREPEARAPSGFEYDAQGQLQYIPGGPADPAYAGRVSGARRDAVVSRPMPSRASQNGGVPGAEAPPWEKYRRGGQ